MTGGEFIPFASPDRQVLPRRRVDRVAPLHSCRQTGFFVARGPALELPSRLVDVEVDVAARFAAGRLVADAASTPASPGASAACPADAEALAAPSGASVADPPDAAAAAVGCVIANWAI